MKIPNFILRLGKLPPRFIYALGLGPFLGHRVLLLTTTGCKSGKERVTPLQYVEANDVIYVQSVRGLKSDWVRNILANTIVQVRLKSQSFRAQTEVITDSEQILDFVELLLKERPRTTEAILRSIGTEPPYIRTQLESYAATIAVVAIHPQENT